MADLYTQEQLAKIKVKMTPERWDALNSAAMGKGWNPDGQMVEESLGRIEDATKHIVGDTTKLDPAKVAQYTPKFATDLRQQEHYRLTYNPTMISAMVDEQDALAKENHWNVSPDNVARMEKISSMYSEVTAEDLRRDSVLREQLGRAYDANLDAAHINAALQQAREMNLDGNGIIMSQALASMHNWILMQGELDTLLGIEASNQNMVMRHIRAGQRSNEAARNYSRAYNNERYNGSSEYKARAAAEYAGAEAELAGLPQFSYEEDGLLSWIKGGWYKPFAQAGLWWDMGMPRVVGAALGATGLPFAGKIGQALGFTAGVQIMQGHMLYELDNLRDTNGNLIEIDDDIKRAAGLMSGVIEAGIEQQQITGAVGSRLSGAFITSSAGKRAFSLVSKSVLGEAFSTAIANQAGFLIEEMVEEGVQGVTRQMVTNWAVRLQQEMRGSNIDYDYAGAKDYATTFVDEAKGSFQSLFLLGVPGSISGGIRTYSGGIKAALDKKEAARNNVIVGRSMAEQWDNLQTRSDSTNLSDKTPEKMRDILNQITGKENLSYLNGEVFVPVTVVNEAFETHIPNQVVRTDLLNRMGVTTDDIMGATVSGSDVVMRMGDMIALLKDKPALRDTLRNAMKVKPDGVAYADVDAAMAQSEVESKELTRTAQALLNINRELDETNEAFVSPEVLAPIIQTPEGIKQVSEELGVDPIILQQMVFDDGQSVPFNVNRIPDHNISDATLSAIQGGITVSPNVPMTLEESISQRAGIRPRIDVVTRAGHAARVAGNMKGNLLMIGVNNGQAEALSQMIAAHYDRQSHRVGLDAEEYMNRYGDIKFVQDKGHTYIIPSIVAPNAKGAISYGEKIQVSITPNADFSTLAHEIMHFFLFDMMRLAETITNADEKAAMMAQIDELKKLAGWTKEQTAWTVPQYEKIADAFVLYLKEGKAPSRGLQKAFRNMKRWLTGFFSNWFEDGETLSDEVRAIFGDMLTLESEAERLMEKHNIRVTPAGVSITTATLLTAELHSIEDVEAIKEKLLVDAINERLDPEKMDIRSTKAYKDAYKKILPDVKAMRVHEYLRMTRADSEFRISRSELQEMLTEEEFAALPKTVYKIDGITADEAALVAEYNNGSELINDILKAPSVEQEADARAMVVIQATKPDELPINLKLELMIDGTADSYHAAVKMLEPVYRGLGWSTANVATEVKLFTAKLQPIADEHVYDMDPKLFPSKRESFIGAVAASRQEYRDAMRVKDYNRAQQAAVRAGLNVAMLRAIKTTQKFYARDMKVLRRAGTIIKAPISKWRMVSDYIGYMEQILANVRLIGDVRRIKPGETPSIISSLEGWKQDGVIAPIAEWLLTTRQTPGNLTARETHYLAEALNWIIKHGRDELASEKAAVKETRASKVKEMVTQLNATYDQSPTTGTSTLRRWGHGTLRLEAETNVLDGKKHKEAGGGKFHEYLYKPLRDAVDNELRLNRNFDEVLVKSFADLLPDAKAEKIFKTKKVEYLGGLVQFTKQELLMLLLHTGMATGTQRIRAHLSLMAKMEMTNDHINLLVGTLTTAELNWLNAQWGIGELLKPMLSEQFKKETGGNIKYEPYTPFKAIPADSKDGTAILMTGGYAPIVYDVESKISTAFRDRPITGGDVPEMTPSNIGDTSFKKYSGMSNIASAGYVQTRALITNYPLTLNVSTIAQHIQEIVHDVTHRSALRQTLALLKNQDLKQAITDTFSKEMWDNMYTLVKRLAGDGTEPSSVIGEIARYFRMSSGSSLVALNASSALNQTLSLATTAAEIGVYRLAKEAVTSVGGVFQLTNAREINEENMRESPVLRDRDRGSNIVVAGHIKKNAKLRGGEGAGVHFMSVYMDKAISNIIYNAAKGKAIDDGKSVEAAAEYAGFILRRNQDFSSQLEQSIMQQTELGKLLSMYYSANGALFNKMWESGQYFREKGIKRSEAFGAFLNEAMKPLLYLTVMSGFIRGEIPFYGDDDGEQDGALYLSWFFKGMASAGLGTVPLIGGLNARGEVNIPATKGFKAVSDMYRLLGNVVSDIEEEGWKYAFQNNGWDFGLAASNLTLLTPAQFPAVAFNRALRAVRDFMEDDGNPWYAIADAAVYNQWTDSLRRSQDRR